MSEIACYYRRILRSRNSLYCCRILRSRNSLLLLQNFLSAITVLTDSGAFPRHNLHRPGTTETAPVLTFHMLHFLKQDPWLIFHDPELSDPVTVSYTHLTLPTI